MTGSCRVIIAIASLANGDLVPVNSRGRRIGEEHPQARYTDREVDLVREMRDGGMSFRRISRKMDMPLTTVWAICACEIRAEVPDHWKRR